MNCLRNSRSVFSRLMVLHRYCNPTRTSSAPRSRSDVLGSIRGLHFRPANPAPCSRTPAPPLPASFPRSWYKETVPYTNRTHRVIFPPNLERELGYVLSEKIKEERGNDILSPSDPNTVRVRLVFSDIVRGIQEVFPTNALTDDDDKQGKEAARPQTGHLRDLEWEAIVIRDEGGGGNACSLPGGKILVFTGLLNFFKTNAEIAVPIAHEAAHVVARHSLELLTILTPPILCELLPFSRRNELEADLIGMMLLAAAGFDPRVAPEVYEKLGETDTVLDDYIGSHPSGKKRARVLSRGHVMKEALELYYKQIAAWKGADRRFS